MPRIQRHLVFLIAAAAVASIALTVERTSNDPPVGVDDRFTVRQGTRLIVDAPGLLGNDFDPDGDPLASALGTNPKHGTIVAVSDGAFVYEPELGYVGVDSFAYAVRDDLGGSTGSVADVTITVVRAADRMTSPSLAPTRPRSSRLLGFATASSGKPADPPAETGATSNPLLPAALLGIGLLIIAFGVRRARNEAASAGTPATAASPPPPTSRRFDHLEAIASGHRRVDAAAPNGALQSEGAHRMGGAGDVNPGVLDGLPEVIEQMSLVGQPVEGADRLENPSMVGPHALE
jgi:hypothetical protein